MSMMEEWTELEERNERIFMEISERRDVIFSIVSDLVSKFLYYDRKEDDELSANDLKEAFSDEIVTVDEIIQCFCKELVRGLRNKEI